MDDDLKKESDALGYQLNLDIYLKAVKLALAKGKKPGDSIEEEIREIMRANPNEVIEIETQEKIIDVIKKAKNPLDLRKKKEEDK